MPQKKKRRKPNEFNVSSVDFCVSSLSEWRGLASDITSNVSSRQDVVNATIRLFKAIEYHVKPERESWYLQPIERLRDQQLLESAKAIVDSALQSDATALEELFTECVPQLESRSLLDLGDWLRDELPTMAHDAQEDIVFDPFAAVASIGEFQDEVKSLLSTAEMEFTGLATVTVYWAWRWMDRWVEQHSNDMSAPPEPEWTNSTAPKGVLAERLFDSESVGPHVSAVGEARRAILEWCDAADGNRSRQFQLWAFEKRYRQDNPNVDLSKTLDPMVAAWKGEHPDDLTLSNDSIKDAFRSARKKATSAGWTKW